MSPGKILIVDDEANARQTLATLLQEDGYEVREAADGYKALDVLEHWRPDVLLTDLRMPLMDGLALMRKARERDPDQVCVVMTAFASVDTAIEAMKAGAQDYLTKPLNFDAVELVLARALERLELRREVARLRERLDQPAPKQLLGTSPPVQSMRRLIEQLAPSRATVLITGESGTGKEIIARQIHALSGRKGEFVPLHCAALPESLLEDELFGHDKGAFTGAASSRKGRFEEAHGGTLFLDEIGEIPPAIQVKLLRVLQERVITRLGSNRQVELDVRIVCATNRDLRAEVQHGRFREDLYYRLNVFHLEAPPLRQRRSDIIALAHHFIARSCRDNDKRVDGFTPEAQAMLEAYHWPGNVRELENAMERAVILTPEGAPITPSQLADELHAHAAPALHLNGASAPQLPPHLAAPGTTLADLERHAILTTYEASGGSTLETARALGVSQRKIQYRLQDYRDAGLLAPE